MLDEPLLDASCGQVSGEEDLLVVGQHTLLGEQETHTKCPDHEIRLDAPDDTLADAITRKPEIHAIPFTGFWRPSGG
jgi:hypothetical protein